MWNDLANVLNSSAEGPKKNAEEWRKVKALLKNFTLIFSIFIIFLNYLILNLFYNRAGMTGE